MNLSLDTGSVHETVSTALEHANEPLYLLRPTAELITIFIESATETDSPPIHVLAAEHELKSIRETFPRASLAADLVKDDRLTLTPSVPEGWGTIVAVDDTSYAFAHVDEHEFVSETTGIPKKIQESCARHRSAKEKFNLRTPPWSIVVDTLTESLGGEIKNSFSTAIETLATLEEPTIDEVEIALLVAAKHEVLLYDLTHWAEHIQLRSRATFSRVKGNLEDANVLHSEKVPIDVGRPRQRLILNEDYATLSIPELVQKANTV